MVRAFIHRKTTFALRRLERNGESVAARLEVKNNRAKPYGGICHIDLRLIGEGQIHVFSSGLSISDCILQAIRKMQFEILRTNLNENTNQLGINDN